ncbi:MAG: hypothetical protein NT023_04540 [Armatimonadetes bacterium]|nr:hypothetical protein [Armatimonadota bacterium]
MAVNYVEKIRQFTRQELIAMLDKLLAGEAIEEWASGKAFEHVILRAFELESATVKWPYRVKDPLGKSQRDMEQIDGAVYHDGMACLIEAKDESGHITIEPIAKLQYQLSRRPVGALGLMFSINGFTEPAKLLACFAHPMRILLWEGNELRVYIERSAMCKALTLKYRHAVEHSQPEYSAVDELDEEEPV